MDPSKRTPDFYAKFYDHIVPLLKLIRKNKSFLILSHANPDGDAVGSQIALGRALKLLGKTVQIVNEHGTGERFAFLKGAKLVKTPDAKIKPYDVCIILDTAIFRRIGTETMKLVSADKPCVNIDHHVSNPEYAKGINLVDPSAAATGQMLYHIISLLDSKQPNLVYDPIIMEALYSAISTDTGSFQYGNTNVGCHEIAAALIENGLDAEKLNISLYGSSPVRRLLLLKSMLQTLKFAGGGTIACMSVSHPLRKRLNLQVGDTTGVIQNIREIDTVVVAIIFDALGPKDIRLSFRSKSDLINVNELAGVFGGGGHAQAAGATLRTTLAEAESRVIAATQGWLANKTASLQRKK